MTPRDLLEKLRVKDMSNAFIERACASFCDTRQFKK
jgi:hypothetical protein